VFRQNLQIKSAAKDMLKNTLMWDKAKGNLVNLMICDADSCPMLLLTFLQQIFKKPWSTPITDLKKCI